MSFTARWKSAIFLTMVSISLTGCGGGGGDDANQPTPTPTPTPTVSSVSEAITKAEQENAIPVLNRDGTILGVDANHDGVRDDIEAYINKLPDSSPQKLSLHQSSAAISASMTVDISNQSSLSGAASKIDYAIQCIYSKYDSVVAAKKVEEMEKINVNTKERFSAYEKFNSALSGTSSLRAEGDVCEN